MSYTTEAKINTFLGETITSGDADDYIAAAEAYIDGFTGRKFVADASASERVFDGNDREKILIDECVAITQVKVGNDYYGDSQTVVAAALDGNSPSYRSLPNNALVKGLPISEILLRGKYFVRGIGNHAITAKWGYSVACPDDISFAATVLAAGMYAANRSSGTGEVKTESIGAYSVTYDIGSGDGKWGEFTRALEILKQYKRIIL